ncbi:MAG: hypothetical protein C4516_09120 [Oxalobacter sp.]|nr:MAG: hypothetical protein C4516_09120 [Oxalobacter sp.]
MYVFLDTEFTSLEKRQLISIGLVSLCGEHIFYREVQGYKYLNCSDFVKKHVLPQLSRKWGTMIPLPEIRHLLLDWFSRLHLDKGGNLTVIVDNEYDVEQLRELMGQLPNWIEVENIGHRLDSNAFEGFLNENNLKPHHALNDARANRHAFMVGLKAAEKR